MRDDRAVTEPASIEQALRRGRLSLRQRLARVRAKGWHLAQASVAAGVAWLVATEVLGHAKPFFAPVAAVVCLGTSYSQRIRRVLEVMLGVATGVLVADLLVLALGSGAWQLSLIVALAMVTALMLDAGGIFVTQAAVQSIIITALAVTPDQALLRWTDALVGGVVALAAATIVPAAPLRRPRDQAAVIPDKIGPLLRGAADGIAGGDVDAMLELLSDARSTDVLIGELRQAADEGMSVVHSSPFRLRHRGAMRQMIELVEPLDLALRNTRVIVRRAAVAAYRHTPVPPAYAELCRNVADAADAVAVELRADRLAEAARPRLLAVGSATSHVERSSDLTAEVILAQLRSVLADLLRITGMDPLESTDAIPPLDAA